MQTSALTGIELILPYAIAFVVLLAIVVALVFVYRRQLETWLASLTDSSSGADGFVRVVVLLCVAVLSTLGSIEVVTGVMSLVGRPLAPWMTFVSVVVGVVVTFFAARHLFGRSRMWFTGGGVLLAAAVLLVASIGLAGHFNDVSWDGQCYHEQAILSIADGWDFARDPQGLTVKIGSWKPVSYPGRPFDTHVVHASLENPNIGDHKWWTPGTVWDVGITHYAKGGWIRAAAIYQLTGRLQQVKSLNIVFLFLQFAVWVAVVLAIAPKRWRMAFLGGALMAANPITMVQLFSNKNDGQLGSLLTILIGLICLYLAEYTSWPVIASICLALMMLITIKFTGLVYAGVVAVGFAVALVAKKAPPKRILTVGSAVLATTLLTVLVVAYNPYVQNTIDHGSPMYPLLGKGSVDTVSNQWPVNFAGTNEFTRLALSLFSRTSDDEIMAGDTTHLKVPFMIYPSEIRPYLGFDVRIGGLGPWFGGGVLLSAILLVLLALQWRRTRQGLRAGGFLLTVVILGSVFANPQSWWARYAPQMWMVPVVVAGTALLAADSKRVRILAWTLVAVLAVNTALVGVIIFSNVVHGDKEMNTALAQVAAWRQPVIIEQGDFQSSWVKLQERGIKWRFARKGQKYQGGLKIPYSTATIYPVSKNP